MSLTRTNLLPLPTFYRPKNADRWDYTPDQEALFTKAGEWARKHKIPPSGKASFRIHLLLIDLQKDFCFPKGSLYVGGRSGTGAMDDNRKISEFIYRNLGNLTEITCTMDTHFPYQIFFPSFWEDKDGAPVPAHTVIQTEMVKAGDVRPSPSVANWICNGNYPWLLDYVRHYCDSLEKAGKYMLYLWPYHCLLGSDGHALTGVIHEARLFHSFARSSKAMMEVKGGGILTENYSVLSPEVLTTHDGRPIGQRNTQFIKTLLDSDAVIIAGQAASHCVKSSIEDLLGAINEQDPKLVKKCYILKDSMSSVAVPDGNGGFAADFTPQAEKALKEFEAAGMHVVDSTTPLEDWDGIQL